MRNLRLLTFGLALGLCASAQAQSAQEKSGDNKDWSNLSEAERDRAEQNVRITQGPSINNITGNAATIKWTTDNVSANHVKYRSTSGGQWKTAFIGQGSKDHSVQLTGLEPNKTYEYQILTRQKNVRSQGQFQTAASAGGTIADVNASGSSGASVPAAASAQERVPLYRALDPKTKAHAYVTSQSEIPAGFSPEGIAGYLLKEKIPGTEAVYKLHLPATGDYLYTIDTRERDFAVRTGYQDQGVIGYAAKSRLPGTEPLYKLQNNSNNQHFYTSADAERESLIRNGSFKDRGVGFHVWQQ